MSAQTRTKTKDRTTTRPHDIVATRPTQPRSPGVAPVGRVRARAYAIYQGRVSTGAPGDATSDWIQAERELEAASAKDLERGEALMRDDD